MSSEDFEILINLIGPKVEKKNTRFREAIPIKERLAIRMRFLATFSFPAVSCQAPFFYFWSNKMNY
nr:unnamed protein product [Callosobruchus chinensis]